MPPSVVLAPAEGGGVPPEHRRLRNGLLVAQLPAALPGGPSEAGPVLPGPQLGSGRVAAIMESVVLLAEHLKLEVVAEGIETLAQLEQVEGSTAATGRASTSRTRPPRGTAVEPGGGRVRATGYDPGSVIPSSLSRNAVHVGALLDHLVGRLARAVARPSSRCGSGPGAGPACAACSVAVNLKLCAGTTRSSWSAVVTSVAG